MQASASGLRLRYLALWSFTVLGIVFTGTQWIVDGLAGEAHVFPQSAFRFGRARFNARRRHGVAPDKPVYPHAIPVPFLNGERSHFNHNSRALVHYPSNEILFR